MDDIIVCVPTTCFANEYNTFHFWGEEYMYKESIISFDFFILLIRPWIQKRSHDALPRIRDAMDEFRHSSILSNYRDWDRSSLLCKSSALLLLVCFGVAFFTPFTPSPHALVVSNSAPGRELFNEPTGAKNCYDLGQFRGGVSQGGLLYYRSQFLTLFLVVEFILSLRSVLFLLLL